MYVIECLPLRKGLKKESLSYFGPEYVEAGSLLKVNLRGKNVPAVVLGSREASEAKTEIKSASFQIKKISGASRPFLQKEFLEAVTDSAHYFAAAAGGVLAHLVPSFILENPDLLGERPESLPEDPSAPEYPADKKTVNEVAALQAPDEERLTHFRSLVREEFAKKKSVFLCLPQNEDVREMKEKLGRGIESYVYAFHNEMSKQELKKEWKQAAATAHPVLILGTAQWLFLPRADLGVIIVEKENENGWKTLARPFMDLRFFAERLASKKRLKIVLADSFLRVETLHRYKQGEISEFESVKWRLPGETAAEVVDLRELTKKEKEFKTLSPEMLRAVQETVEKGSRLFMFAARKGLSSVTVCRDCGEEVRCGNCAAPMVLYKRPKGNVFKCHHCGETRDAAEVCKNCGSWKLAAFGAGLDRVAEELRKNFPDIKLFELHKDLATTPAKAANIAEDFYATRGSILLGTEMALSYLHKKVALTAVASFDSLFSIPDFRIKEKIFRLILQIKNLAKEKFLLQTRNLEDQTLKYALSGNLAEFYKKETDERQVLNYPPFGLFVKVTARGTRNFVTKETEILKEIFEAYNPAVFNSIHEKRGEQAAVNAVIKLKKEDWLAPRSSGEVGPALLSLLNSLPPHFEIKVDPDNLL